MRAPPWAPAWVTAQDPDNEAVFVSLDGPYGGQGPTVAVQVGGHGPRDGVTGHYPALPTQGTHGLVAFPRGDYRNGVWICSISTQLTDASAHAPGNGAADYAAHYGGGWSWRGQDGTVVEALPDGTIVQLGPVLPAPTRHTIDGSQVRQRTAFAPAQRVPQAPSAFPLTISHPTGASGLLTASGAWQLSAAPGQTVVIKANGASVTIDASGNLQIVGITSIAMTGNVAVSGTIIATGNITAGASGVGAVELLHHTHTLSGGAGTGGPPTPGS